MIYIIAGKYDEKQNIKYYASSLKGIKRLVNKIAISEGLQITLGSLSISMKRDFILFKATMIRGQLDKPINIRYNIVKLKNVCDNTRVK